MTSPEAEDMNMISASVVGLLFEKDMKLNKPQNIVGTASLYGHALNTLWQCFLIWTYTQRWEGVFNFLVELTRSKNFKKN